MWMKDKYLYSCIVCIHIVLSVSGPHMSSHWHHGTQEEQHGAGGDHDDRAGEILHPEKQSDNEYLDQELDTDTIKWDALKCNFRLHQECV